MAGTALVNVELDQQRLDELARRVRHIPRALSRIVPRALNRAITAKRDPGSAYNTALHLVAQALPTRRSALKRRLFANRAKNIRWEASIVAGRRPFHLVRDLGARAGRLGVTMRAFGRTVRFPQAFIPSGRTAFVRQPLASTPKGWRGATSYEARVGRLPIEVVPGPAIEDAWVENPSIAAEVTRVGRRRIESTLYVETENEIAKRMPR